MKVKLMLLLLKVVLPLQLKVLTLDLFMVVVDLLSEMMTRILKLSVTAFLSIATPVRPVDFYIVSTQDSFRKEKGSI